jgi:hypothetical protein
VAVEAKATTRTKWAVSSATTNRRRWSLVRMWSILRLRQPTPSSCSLPTCALAPPLNIAGTLQGLRVRKSTAFFSRLTGTTKGPASHQTKCTRCTGTPRRLMTVHERSEPTRLYARRSMIDWQCSTPCTEEVWPLPSDYSFRVERQQMVALPDFPKCGRCGGHARPAYDLHTNVRRARTRRRHCVLS